MVIDLIVIAVKMMTASTVTVTVTVTQIGVEVKTWVGFATLFCVAYLLNK